MIRTFARTALAVTVVAISQGCTGSTSDTDGPIVTDSAGVRIVTSSSTDKPLPWRFEQRGVLTDSVGEPYLFNGLHPTLLTVTSNGHVFALDRHANGLVRFDETLNEVGMVGRQGGGPGELQFALMIGNKHDTLMALDAAKQGIVRWDIDGKPLSTLRIDGLRSSFAAVGNELWYVGREGTDSTLDQVLIRQRFRDAAATPDGNAIRETSVDEPTPPATVLRVVNKKGGPVDFTCVRLSTSTEVFAPSLNWSTAGDRIAMNGEARYNVTVMEGGKQTLIIRRDIPTRAPTEEDVKLLYPEGFKVAFDGGRPDCTAPVSEVMKQFGVAPTLPLVHDLRMLADGSVWVRRTPRGNVAATYDVFDSDGEYAGTTDVDPLHALPDGDILVAQKDEESGGFVVQRMRIIRD